MLPQSYLWPPLLVLASAGCQQDTSFLPRKFDSLTLYSLECRFDKKDVPDRAEMFHGYLVLGKAEITDAPQDDIIAAIREDIATGSTIYNCFDPHHAVRLVTGDTTIDIVICYHCRSYERTENGKLDTTSFPMNVQSRELMNRILKSKGIVLSAEATEELPR